MTTTRRATTTGGSWCWSVHSRKLLGFNGSGSGGFWPTLEPLEPWKLLVCRVLESWFLIPTVFHVGLRTPAMPQGGPAVAAAVLLLLSWVHLFVAQQLSNRSCFNFF